MRRTVSLVLLLGLACRSGPEKPVIAVSLLTQTHDFYKDLEEGLREEGGRRGFDLVVASSEFNPATQASQIEDFVVKRVKAIVVCPSDSSTVGRNLEVAERAGIPVFTADIAAHTGRIVSHVASDNKQGGRLAAAALARYLGGQGKVLIIDHPTVASVQDRTDGFDEEMKKHPGIQVVARPAADGQRAKALSVMEDMLQAHPDLRGVFAINDDSALGALSAVERAARANIVIVGFDATPEARAAIARGSALKADVSQSPREIGLKTIDVVARHLAGEKVPAVIPVAVALVEQQTAASR